MANIEQPYDGTDTGYANLTVSGLPIGYHDIYYVALREWVFDFVPTIKVAFRSKHEFVKALNIQEGDSLTIEMSGKQVDKKDPNIKKLEFEIRGANHSYNQSGEIVMFVVVGVLKTVNYLSPIQSKSFHELPVSKVLEQIMDDVAVKDKDIRISESNDKQTWIQFCTTHRFVQDILKHSYMGEDDTLLAFVNRDRKLVISSAKQAMNSEEIKNLEFWPEGFGEDFDPSKIDVKDRIYPFIGFDSKDGLSQFNLEQGYGIGFTDYNYDTLNQTIWSTISNKLSSFSSIDKNKLGGGVGKFRETYQPPSAHPNFSRARHINDFVKGQIFSNPTHIIMQTSADIHVLDKVNISFSRMDSDSYEKDTNSNVDSGKYLIGGIVHFFQTPRAPIDHVILFRGGQEKALAMTSENMTSVKSRGN